MDTETQKRWNRINRAACYYFAGQTVIYGLGGIEYEEVILTPDDSEIAGEITKINKRLSTLLINSNHDELSLRDKIEKIVRGLMAAKIAENRFVARFENDWGEDWLEEFLEGEVDKDIRDYFNLLSPWKNEEEIWAYAELLSVQTEHLVDQHWGTIKRVAQGVYRRHRMSRKEVEAFMAA